MNSSPSNIKRCSHQFLEKAGALYLNVTGIIFTFLEKRPTRMGLQRR